MQTDFPLARPSRSAATDGSALSRTLGVKERIEMSLQQHPETRHCHVTVAARHGIVMLTGSVSSRLEREQVVSIAWSTPGVTLVKIDLATRR